MKLLKTKIIATVILTVMLISLLTPLCQVEAKESKNKSRLTILCSQDEIQFLADGFPLFKFKIYVDEAKGGRVNLKLQSSNDTATIYSGKNATVIFKRVSESKVKFDAYVNASSGDKLIIEVSGNVKKTNTKRLAAINTLTFRLALIDFSDAPQTQVESDKIIIPLNQGLNIIDPYIEVIQYIQFTPPQLQAGDVLAPHLYASFFDGIDDYVVVGLLPNGQGTPFTMYGWNSFTVVSHMYLYHPKAMTQGSARFNILGDPSTDFPSIFWGADAPADYTQVSASLFVRRADNTRGIYDYNVFAWRNTYAYFVQRFTVDRKFSVWVNAEKKYEATVPSTDRTILEWNPDNATYPNQYKRYVIGGNELFNSFMKMLLGELRIYNRALSDTEIAERQVINASGLKVFLDATFYNGTHYIDLSGNSNCGTPYNGVQRVPANSSWLWVVRGLHNDSFVRLRFFPQTSIIAFKNGSTMDLTSYQANSVGLVELLTLSYSDASNIDYIIAPAPQDILYTGYPENPETVYAGVDTTFGVLVRHNSSYTNVTKVTMKLSDVTFEWTRDGGFREVSDPRNVSRLDTVNSYVIVYNSTLMAVYFKFRLDYKFDIFEGHAWHNVLFEAYAEGGYYTVMPVQEAFQFVDTLTPVDLIVPSKVAEKSYVTIHGRMVYSGTNITPADYYGVHVNLYDGDRLLAKLDPSVNVETGEFTVRFYVDKAGNYTLRVMVEASDGEVGYNNYVSFNATQMQQYVKESSTSFVTVVTNVFLMGVVIVMFMAAIGATVKMTMKMR